MTQVIKGDATKSEKEMFLDSCYKFVDACHKMAKALNNLALDAVGDVPPAVTRGHMHEYAAASETFTFYMTRVLPALNSDPAVK